MLQLGMSWLKAPWFAMKSLLPARALTRLSMVGRQGFCMRRTSDNDALTLWLSG